MCRSCRNNRFYESRPWSLWTPYGKESNGELGDHCDTSSETWFVRHRHDIVKNFVLSCLYRIEQGFEELQSLTNHNLYTLRELDLLSHPRVSFLQAHFEVVSLLLFEGRQQRHRSSDVSTVASSSLSPSSDDRLFTECRYYRDKSFFHFLKGEYDAAIEDLKSAMKMSLVDNPRDYLALAKLHIGSFAHSRAYKTLKIGLSFFKTSLKTNDHIACDLEEEMTSLMHSLENRCIITEPIVQKVDQCARDDRITTIDSLPEDVLIHIFSHLIDARDLIDVALVSKRWQDVALSRTSIFAVLTHHLGHQLANDLISECKNPVEALQKVYEARCCWGRLSIHSTLFNLLSFPAFADLYPGESDCTVELLSPSPVDNDQPTTFIGPIRAWRQRQKQILSDYEIPIGDFIDPDCDLSRPFDVTSKKPKEVAAKRTPERRRKRNLRGRPRRGNESRENHEKEKQQREEEELKTLLPADFQMHYRLHNGAQIHLDSYPPPEAPRVKDGSGRSGGTFVFNLSDEAEEARRAFYHYDFTLYPITSAGVFHIQPMSFFGDLSCNGKVPSWFDSREGPVVHVGRHGPRHYVTVRKKKCQSEQSISSSSSSSSPSTTASATASSEVMVYSLGGYDSSRLRCRAWPSYAYESLPFGTDELVGTYPSFSSYLERLVCPEVEKGLLNLLQKMIDVWNASKRSREEVSELADLLDDPDSVVREKAMKKLSAGKTVALLSRSNNHEPARLLLAGTHTAFVVRTYRDRFSAMVNTNSR